MLCRTIFGKSSGPKRQPPMETLLTEVSNYPLSVQWSKSTAKFQFHVFNTAALFIICVHKIRTLKADYNLISCIILYADLIPVKIPKKKEKNNNNKTLQHCRRAAETSAAHKQTWTKLRGKLRESRSPGSRGLRREAVHKYVRGKTTGWTERAASLFVGPIH